MTKKYVLTGGPCSGKTTLINEFKRRGFSILEEVARKVLKDEKPVTTYDEFIIRERKIYLKQLVEEARLEHDAFLDRSNIDVIAYCNHHLGECPSDFYAWIYDYSAVFVLDQFAFVKDDIRLEKDDIEARAIHNSIIKTYTNLGYSPIRVPIFLGSLEESVSKRADFVFEHVKKLGGKK